MPPPGFYSPPQFQEDGAAFEGGAGDRLGGRRRLRNRPLALQRLLDSLNDQAKSTARIVAALFTASALLNVLVGVLVCYRSNPEALDWDETEYWDMAGGILGGAWDFGERRTIGFPLIIAALRLVANNFLFVQISLSIIAALSAPLLYCLVRRIGGTPGLGLLAGILITLWPAQLFLATSLYSETVALPCFLLFLLLLPPGSRVIGADGQWPGRWQTSAAGLAGLALGLCAQIRPMYLLFLPLALIIPFLEEQSRRLATRTALLVALGFAVIVLPWSALMSVRHGELIILTANGGETLAGGLNPRLVAMPDTDQRLANRDTWVGPGKWLPPQNTGYLLPSEAHLPYPAMSRLLRQRSVAWIVGNPGESARIELCKLAYMWGFYPWRGDDPLRLLAGNLPILALLAGVLVTALRRPVPWLALARLWTVPLFVTGIALISWGSWRFRQPADAALIALCIIAASVAPRRPVGAFKQ